MDKLWLHLDREVEILSIQINGPRLDAGVDDYPAQSYGIYRNMKTGAIEGWLVFECISLPERSLPLGFEKRSPRLEISFRRGRLRGSIAGDEIFSVALKDGVPTVVKLCDFALAAS